MTSQCGTGRAHWYERDDFWRLVRKLDFPPETFSVAERDAAAISHKLGLHPGAAVLDLACGPGRHALAFARDGIRVLGVDITEQFVEEARVRARGVPLVTFQVGDMRRFRMGDAFDAAVCLWTSFGYGRFEQEHLAALQNVYSSLRSGGRFLLDAFGKEVEARRFVASGTSVSNGITRIEQRRVTDGWSYMEQDWTFVEGERRCTFTIDYRLYSGRELCESLYEAGFDTVQLFGGYDWREYGPTAHHLLALATRR